MSDNLTKVISRSQVKKYQLIKISNEESFVKRGTVVTWDENCKAYYDEDGYVFSRKDVELSGNWKPI
jgi:hypothetical protein